MMMAQQDLIIKLKVDTSETGKIQTVLDQQNKAIDKAYKSSLEQIKINNERYSLLAQAQVKEIDLQKAIVYQNSLIAQEGTSAYLANTQAIHRANKELEKYNSELDKINAKLRTLNTNEASLTFASGKSPTSAPVPALVKPGTSFEGVAGLSSTLTPTQIAKQKEILDNFNASTEKIEKEALERRNFATKAANNAKVVMYGDMFSQIEEQGKRHDQVERQLLDNHIMFEHAANQRRIAQNRADAIAAFSASNQSTLISGMSSSGNARGSIGTGFTNIISGMSAAGTLAATRAANDLAEAHKKASKATDEHEQSHRGLIIRIIEGVSVYKLYNATLNTVWNSLKAIPKIGIELDSTKASLLATAGGVVGMGNVLVGLEQEANRTGIQIGAVRESFRLFQASTSLAGESLYSTWRMFTNLNTVSTALHLSVDKTNGLFLAMAQIFNKGKVQSEELVKQLGNLLPGAFASMAASMGINTQKLSSDMKKGLVTAHDVMEDFTSYMAQRFQPAFASSSTGLNANIGRMQTSFTLLGEAIYASTSGPMLTVVKSITSLTNYLKDGVTGVNNFGSAISTVFNTGIALSIGALGNYILGLASVREALGKTITSVGLTQTAMVGLSAAFNFLVNPVTIIAGIALISKHLLTVGDDARQAGMRIREALKEQIKEINATTPQLKLELEIDKSDNVVQAKNRYIELAAILDKEREKKKNDTSLGGLFSISDKELSAREDELFMAKKNYQTQRVLAKEKLDLISKTSGEEFNIVEAKNKALEDARVTALSHAKTVQEAEAHARENFLKTHADNIANLQAAVDAGIGFRGVGPLKNIKPVGDLQLQAAKEAAEGLKQFKEGENREALAAVEQFNNREASLLKKAASDAKTIRTANYADLKRNIDNEAYANSIAADNLENNYKNNIIDLESYFNQRQELINKNAGNKQRDLTLELNQAIAGGDAVEIAKARDLLTRSELEKAKLTKENNLARLDGEKAYKEMVDKTIAERLTAEGDVLNAAQASFAVRHKTEIELANINSNSSNVAIANAAKLHLIELDRLGTAEELNKVFTRAELEKSKSNDVYNASLAKTNTLANLGVIGPLQAFKELDAAREASLVTLEKTIAIERDALLNSKGTSSALIHEETLNKTLTQFELLRAEGSSLARHFETSLGSAFDSAFTNVITGSLSASEAFKSFGVSVVKTIADIVAQEMRSAILRPLVSSAFSAIGGLFSSGTSVAADNSAGFASAVGSSTLSTPFSWKAANGGVATGVSSMSNSVLTSPTLFPSAKIIPFARGGVLAGEAGSEAIMPLTRDSSGKLGVKATINGSGNLGGNVYHISVTVQQTKDQSADATGQQVAQAMMRAIAQQEIATANRPGNQSNRVTNFR